MKTGDVVPAKEIGHKGSHPYVWFSCPDCGKEWWVLIRNGKPQSSRCASCAAKKAWKSRDQRRDKHPRWKGGRCVTTQGYIEINLSPDDPFFPMADKDRYVLEHRLVMAKSLGRCLESSEIVHHVNHKKGDNRIKNLRLYPSRNAHFRHHQRDVASLLLRIEQLESQLRS